MPRDVSCTHGDATCCARHPAGRPPTWVAVTRRDLGCHQVQRAILLFKTSSMPGARRVPCHGVCLLTELRDALVRHEPG